MKPHKVEIPALKTFNTNDIDDVEVIVYCLVLLTMFIMIKIYYQIRNNSMNFQTVNSTNTQS